MYAVIETGGKQYKVRSGQRVKVELLPAKVGDVVVLDKVLLLKTDETTEIGAPYLTDCKVEAEVLGHRRDKKIKIIKLKRRKHHMKRMGHRQHVTELKIGQIVSKSAFGRVPEPGESAAVVQALPEVSETQE